MSPGRAKLLVTALRSFLRYLRHHGEISVDLAACVPSVAVWSFSTVPKFLPAGTVQRFLDQCERNTPDGKRNYAVLLLLARLGLRACEIVSLSLDDIDWDNGRLTIRCKGGRWTQLPLPSDVGEAIAIYLRSGRPCSGCRHVFLRHRAPIHGFTQSTTVSAIVRRALIRARHRFRPQRRTSFSPLCRFPDYAARIRTKWLEALRIQGCLRASHSTCGIVRRLGIRVV